MEANPHTLRRQTGSVPRALPAFWAVVTLAYFLVAGYGTVETRNPPGLSSAAGMAAVAAVWLEIIDRLRATPMTGLIVACALWMTLVTNGYVAGAMYRSTGNVPVTRSLLSMLFAYLLIDKLLQLRNFRAQQKGIRT